MTHEQMLILRTKVKDLPGEERQKFYRLLDRLSKYKTDQREFEAIYTLVTGELWYE